MIEDSQFLGTQQYTDEEQIRRRIGKRDPPIGVSLFTGVGGFDLGMEQAGVDVRVMIEEDAQACETLRMNIPDFFCEHTKPEIFEQDIRKVSTKQILEAAGIGVGGVSTVFGGPPCPGFSHANPDRSRDDPRNQLYKEMVRVVQEAKPVNFVMENVKGLTTMDDGDVIRQVCNDFRDCGYNVTWDILDAADYGVPQHRERVFVIGKRVDVMGMPEYGNPQIHIGARPGTVNHPEWFREKHDDLKEPGQAGLNAYSEPETLEEFLDQMIERGGPE